MEPEPKTVQAHAYEPYEKELTLFTEGRPYTA